MDAALSLGNYPAPYERAMGDFSYDVRIGNIRLLDIILKRLLEFRTLCVRQIPVASVFHTPGGASRWAGGAGGWLGAS